MSDYDSMTPTQLRSELEQRKLPVPDPDVRTRAFREHATEALHQNDALHAAAEPEREAPPEPHSEAQAGKDETVQPYLASAADELDAIVKSAEQYRNHLTGLGGANEYVRAVEYVERAIEGLIQARDNFVMGRDEVGLAAERLDDLTKANQRKAEARRNTFRVRAVVENAFVDADDPARQTTQNPARSFSGREAAIESWREGGRDHARVVGSGRKGQFKVTALSVIDGDGNVEKVW